MVRWQSCKVQTWTLFGDGEMNIVYLPPRRVDGAKEKKARVKHPSWAWLYCWYADFPQITGRQECEHSASTNLAALSSSSYDHTSFVRAERTKCMGVEVNVLMLSVIWRIGFLQIISMDFHENSVEDVPLIIGQRVGRVKYQVSSPVRKQFGALHYRRNA